MLHGWGNGMHSWGGVLMILFWVLIIFGVVYLIKNYNDKNSRDQYSRNEDKTVRIARERYVRGEISKEEFEEVLNDLQNER